MDEESRVESPLSVHSQAASTIYALPCAGCGGRRVLRRRLAADAEGRETGRSADAIPLVIPVHGREQGLLHPSAPGVSRVSPGSRNEAFQLDGRGSGRRISRLPRRVLQYRPAGLYTSHASNVISNLRGG